MIQINNICLAYGNQTVFKDVALTLSDHQRVGLVGRNGSGKSTLLKVIADFTSLDSGSISIANNKKLGYMPQDVVLASNKSVFEETMAAFEESYNIQKELELLELKLDNATADVLERYCILQEKLAAFDVAQHQIEAEKILLGLGFKKERFQDSVSSLSVGWKMRVVLAKLLLQKADFYLFDEPTNHLDIFAKEWFLQFLKDSNFGFLIVCHEKYFLDQLCDYILELELGNGKVYTGNYSKYLDQKEKDMQLLEVSYLNQQKEIKRKQATIDRFRFKSSKARMAQSMIKELEKVELIELPPSPKDIHFVLPQIQKAPRVVLTVKHLACKFADKEIFKNVSFEVERGQKIAIVAANGVGKTTLFNLIIGAIPLQTGSVDFGDNVKAAIFAQDQNKALNLKKTVLENVQESASKSSEQTIRKFLGSFLFGKEEVEKPVGVLSGGEKNRVGMINVLLQGANLLLLDEPTNHLDIPSKQILLKALQTYDGTMLFVSHDKDFVNDLATHIIELTPNGAYLYHGNYDSFVLQKQITNNAFEAKDIFEKNKNKHVVNPDEIKAIEKDIKQAERVISQIESKILKLSNTFADLEFGSEQFSKNQAKFDLLKKELVEAESGWEELVNKKFKLTSDN